MDRGALQATVRRVAKSATRLKLRSVNTLLHPSTERINFTSRVLLHQSPGEAGCLPTACSQFFNMLSRLVIAFLPRSKHLLVSWLQSPSAVILEPPKIKSDKVSTVSLSISHEVMGPPP